MVRFATVLAASVASLLVVSCQNGSLQPPEEIRYDSQERMVDVEGSFDGGDFRSDRDDEPSSDPEVDEVNWRAHPPIYVTVNAHGHNYGIPRRAYQDFIDGDNLEGWFDLKRARYRRHRDEILWLAEETERVGARMSYQLNGEYARDSRVLFSTDEGDDTGHLRDLMIRGHTMSAHFHPYVLSDENEFWKYVGLRPMTTELMDRLWADHLVAIEEAAGFAVIRTDAAHSRDSDELVAHVVTLLERHNQKIENVGERFSQTHWAHRPWNVFRRDLETELMEDFEGPMVAVHSYPQVGQEIPQGFHTVITTVPQLQRRFIDIYMQWLYAQASGQTPRIWTFGLMTHPDSNARFREDIVEMLDWLARMTELESPFGGPVAEFVTDTSLLERYESWEAEYPGVSSFSFDLETYEAGGEVSYPYDLEGMVLATRDGEFVRFLDTWENQSVLAVELTHRHVERSEPRDDGSITTEIGGLEEDLYVLWTHGDPVTIDLSDEIGMLLFGCHGDTGVIEELDSRAVTVTSTPLVVSSTDAYFSDE